VLQPGEGLLEVVVELVTRVSHHGEVVSVIALLPPFDEDVVPGLVGTEPQQALGHLVLDQQMGLADDHFIGRSGSVAMSALGPESPQAKFFVVEWGDVGSEERGTTGAQGVDEPEVSDVVCLEDRVQGAVEVPELRVEPLQPRLSALEPAGVDE
jgi:hypothetical protein